MEIILDKSSYFEVDNGVLHYKSPSLSDIKSDKPIMLFLHGANRESQHTEFWVPVIDIMHKYCYPVRLDLFGHGQSTYRGQINQVKMVDAINHLIDYILEMSNQDSLMVIGRSYGGAIAQILANSNDRISGLGLIAPAGINSLYESLKDWSHEISFLWDTKDPIISINYLEKIYKISPDVRLFTIGGHELATKSVMHENTKFKKATHAPELSSPELFESFISSVVK